MRIIRIILIMLLVCCNVFFSNPSASAQTILPDNFALPFVTLDKTTVQKVYPVLTPLINGPIRVLFIGDRQSVAPIAAAVISRLDCTTEVVLTSSRTMLGMPDTQGSEVPATLLESSVRHRLEKLLDDTWDVIWLDIDLLSTTDGLREAILAKVDAGTGLVMAGDRDQARRIAQNRRSEARLSEPFKYNHIDDPEVLTRGNGTVINLPEPPPVDALLDRGGFDNLAAFALIYASGNPTMMTIREIQVAEKPVEQEVIAIMKYRVRIYNNSGIPDSLTVKVRCRNQYGLTVNMSETIFRVDREEVLLSIPYPILPIGTYALDITGTNDRGVVFFGGTTFSVETDEHIAQLSLWDTKASRGDFITGTISVTTPFREGAYVVLELRDKAGRVLERELPDIVTGRKSTDFIMRIREQYPATIVVAAGYYKNNSLVEEVTRLFIVSDDTPSTFRFGVSIPFEQRLTPKQFQELTGDGVSLFSAPLKVTTNPADIYTYLRTTVAAGLKLVPDISSYTESKEETVQALLDTLDTLNPEAIFVRNDEQASQLRKIAPDIAVILPTGTELKQNDDTGRPDSLISIIDTATVRDISVSQGEMDANAVGDGLLVPDTWKYPNDERLLGAIPWWSFLSGYHQLWWDAAQEEFSAVTPWGTLSPSSKIVAHETQWIESTFIHLVKGAVQKNVAISDIGVQICDDNGELIPESSVTTRVWHDGNISYIGVALIPGVKTQLPPFLNIAIDRAGAPAYLYNIRESRLIGAVSSMNDSLSHGSLLLALLPYRVQAIEITLDDPIVDSDSPINFNARINTAGSEPLGHHAFRVELFHADRDGLPLASLTVDAPDGLFNGSIQIPQDADGTCMIRIRDMATGKSNERPVIVRRK